MPVSVVYSSKKMTSKHNLCFECPLDIWCISTRWATTRRQASIPSAPGSISFAWRRRSASICSLRATRRSISCGSRLSTGLQRSRSSTWATSPAWIFSKSTTISTWIQMDSLITRSVTATTPTLQAKIHKTHYNSERLPSQTIRENNQHRASRKTHKFCIRRE